ncbi:MAG: sigma E protease regulator RseP [Candidatus Malihini olakiniferum]
MMNVLWSLAAFIVALGILITVHEFGHFWVARCYGVKVERFSVGFGKALWRWRDRLGTEFVISIIPLGGYVKMLDERVDKVSPEQHYLSFNCKTVWQRAAIVSAGPIANFLFAVVAYWLVFIIGVPGVRPVVGEIVPNSIAAVAQMSPVVELKAVDGIETPDWDAVLLALIGKIGNNSVTIDIAPLGSSSIVRKTLDLRDWQFNPKKQDPASSLGMVPFMPQIDAVLTQIQQGSAAQKAGLQVGDRIVRFDKQPLTRWSLFASTIRDKPDVDIALDIERNGETLSLILTPDSKTTSGRVEGFMGAAPKVITLPAEYQTVRQYGPLSAIYQAADKIWQLMRLTGSMLGKLITGDVKLNNLSGPISIAQYAGMSADYGLIYYLMFLALISVNLGIINFFPLPILDGGHLFFLLIEKLKGRPVSERVQHFCYRIGTVALMLLMGLALFNDFSRL